jgi:hypothetical protein
MANPTETDPGIIPFIQQALDEHRYETARRHCALAHADGRLDDDQYARWLFEACIGLSDPQATRRLIDSAKVDAFNHALMQMRYFSRFNNTGTYRTSIEKVQGYTQFEYVKLMTQKLVHWYEQAQALAKTPEQKTQIDAYVSMYIDADLPPSLRQALERGPIRQPEAPIRQVVTGNGTLSGRMTHEDGHPVANCRVVLGLEVPSEPVDVLNYLESDMHFSPKIGKVQGIETVTDEQGFYTFDHVPVGCHAFLAVCLDPLEHANCTRFVARDLTVHENRTTQANHTLKPWASAPAQPMPREMKVLPVEWIARESTWQRIGHMTLRNPFAYDFPRQFVTLDWPENHDASELEDDQLFVLDTLTPDHPQPCQLIDGAVSCMTSLDAYTTKRLAIYRRVTGTQSAKTFTRPNHLTLQIADDQQSLLIDTQAAAFSLPYKPDQMTGPILAIQGQDGQWRGQSRFTLPDRLSIVSQKTTIIEQGLIRTQVKVAYELCDGSSLSYTITAHEGEAYLLVHEKINCGEHSPQGAFELSLPDCINGRGYLHWIGGNRGQSWEDLNGETSRQLARLQEQTPWWIPPQGFGYGMTPANLKADDFIAVFTIRRGEWKDEDFDRIAHGPVDGNRELDWPYPEMVGSTISMITAEYTAPMEGKKTDVCFRFPMFRGERYWGIAISERDLNDGPHKHLSELQHKNSSPRLDDFIRWELDTQDTCQRPVVWGPDQRIFEMRKTRDQDVFKHAWEHVWQNPDKAGYGGLSFLLNADPLIAWRTKLMLVAQAPIRARMILLGREYSDMYSPVGARNLTPWCEEYDALAASGVFTEDEERLIRRSFILIGHLHRTRDFMNWNYGSRNANFEADRVDVVGTVGLVFPGNPDAKGFIEHALEMTRQGMKAYCTPESGRWYENPACYYLHAMKCRLHLLIRLAQVGLLDPAQISLLKELLGWGILLLTPGIPATIPQMALPCDDATYHDLNKIRRVAPIGDHASLGSEIPEHWAILADYFDKSDPDFANLLRWAFVSCDGSTGNHGDIPLYLSHPNVAAAAVRYQPKLVSRRLEGFGSVFRDHFNETDEFFLLFKLGPGGYRYHRTEGSILLFVDGKPLIYDGGEDGEAWRHTTLSFFDTHMPLAPGHIERFAVLPTLQFSQGVNPKAIHPGEPDFLNDDCRHELVQVAFDRFATADPVNARSVWWIKDEYALLHDDLHLDPSIPSHWHVQVVAQSETRVTDGDYRFVGRFGTDMQVLLPDQTFIDEQVLDNTLNLGTVEKNRVPFSMRHLQVSKEAATHYTAVLRPLGHRKPIKATVLKQAGSVVGTCVTGNGIDDVLLTNRVKTTVHHGLMQFDGTYGAMLQRDGVLHLMLMDAGMIQYENTILTSNGPSVELCVGQTTTLHCIGEGQVTVTCDGKTTMVTSHDGTLLTQSVG